MARTPSVRISGPLTSYVEPYSVALERLGYTPGSASHQLGLLAHLSRWLEAQGLTGPVTREDLAEFVAARRAAGYSIYRSMRGIAPLTEFLTDVGWVVDGRHVEPTDVEVFIERYRCYLVTDRGLAASTVRTYLCSLRPFLAERSADDGLQLEGLTADEITAFLLKVSEAGQPGRAASTATALRSLLGFLQMEGTVSAPLAGAVPSIATWKLSALPRGLRPEEFARLLGSCDRRTSLGRRDAAMLLLLARLGLRAGEVAGLELDDIDWRSGELLVAGKGGRKDRLPLPDDVGRAIVGYLQRGRSSSTEARAVFVRYKAPHRRLTPEAVSARVFKAAQRAGLESVRAHRLRHTAATSMLAAGAPLAEIGQLLRHRKAATTALYAKTDVEGLRTIARPWPGGGA